MTALLNDPVAPPSQSTMHAVARHRDALQDYARDFQRARVRHMPALPPKFLANVTPLLD